MVPFDYLIQMFSILAGLGIGVLVVGASRLVEERSRVRFFWPHAIWAIALFVAHVSAWFALWGLRVHPQWTMFEALCLLIIPMLVYFSSSVVMPKLDGDAKVDVEEHYFATIRYSQATLQLAMLASVFVTYTVTDVLWSNYNAFRVAACAALLPGLISLHPRVHKVQSAALVILLLVLVSTAARTVR